MPLVKRTVEPVHVSRGAVIASGVSLVRDELEYVGVATLANVVRQLGSLSAHVDDLFDELSREAIAITRRMIALSERTERLKVKITQLNPTVEEVLLQDINMRKPFKSSVIKDQQVISLATRPFAVTEIYRRCEPPPPLQKLNPYRQDGKDSLKFYTEPGYFFELWCQSMQKDAARNQQKRHKRTRRSPYLPQTAEEDEKLAKESQQKQQPVENHRSLSSASQQQRSQPVNCQQNNRCVGENRGAVTRENRCGEVQGSDNAVQLRSTSGAANQGRNQSRPNSLELQNSGPPPSQNQSVAKPAASPNAAPALPIRSTSSTPSLQKNASDALPDDGKPQPNVLPDDKNKAKLIQNTEPSDDAKKSPVGHVENGRIGLPLSPQNAGTKTATSSLTNNHAIVLPSPPPTPPMGKPRSSVDSERIILPSPARSCKSETRDGRKSSTPDSVDLPPPPSPPPQFCQSASLDSPGGVLPPPPLDDTFDAIPPRVSPPPPMSPPPPLEIPDEKSTVNISAANVESTASAATLLEPAVSIVDGLSIASDVSSATVSSGSTMKSDGGSTVSGGTAGEQPLVRDNRSDLLAAIREGIQLRKVEERRLKTAQKHRPTGHLDVQSLMEAAFEIRRKALEENDSENEYEGEDADELNGDWSDVD